MEIIEWTEEKKFCHPACPANQKQQPDSAAATKRTKKYVQPARVKPFTPKTVYCPPKKPIEATTTYHTSYYNEGQARQARPQPIRPINSIHLPDDKLPGDTTTNLSFKPVWGVYKAKPILPRQRLRPQQGPMECLTTIRKDFEAKVAPRPEMIVPSGNIRMSRGAFNGTTTTWLSYMNPGHVEPVSSYRPKMTYRRPAEPTATETTQKLSYVPYEAAKKENYPWAQKPVYRPPETAMPGETTYKKTYLETKAPRETPVLPKDEGVLPKGAEFIESTIYKESFLPCRSEPLAPILPSQNISLSDKKMTGDTTSKLSYQPVKGEKRKPILPRQRKIMSNSGSMESTTTTRDEFVPKIGTRPQMHVPCGNIRSLDSPLEGKTVTSLSFANPGPTRQLQNFKPVIEYCKPEKKVEGETVNKMSYPAWSIGPKEELPWAQKKRYEPPTDAVQSSTIYHMSFPAPGHYVDQESDDGCPCSD